MIPIKITEFVTQTAQNNKGIDITELTAICKAALYRKRNGGSCINCGAEIWAAGSAICGTDMCFSCITGEADDGDDYEIVE